MIPLALVVLVAVLMQSACKQEKEETNYPEELAYISREDFMSKLEDEWYVYAFSTRYEPNTDIGAQLCFYEDEDSVGYAGFPDWLWQRYSVDDSITCTLPYIENLQYWTITQNNDSLILVAQGLCGDTNTYTIDFNNYQYLVGVEMFEGVIIGYYHTTKILAEINLVNADTTITLDGFVNDIGYDALEPNLTFIVWEGDYKSNFILYRL